MSGTYKKDNLLIQKLLFTGIILAFYIIGRSIPLYGVDLSAISEQGISAEMLLQQTIGGDLYQSSLLALGVSPYMISSILVQMVFSVLKGDTKKQISRIKMNRITVEMMLFFALFQAVLRVRKLAFKSDVSIIFAAQLICVLQMVAGVFLILVLAEKNKKYGLGGQTVLFIINIIEGLMHSFLGHDRSDILLPLAIGILAMVEACAMEMNVKKIAVQRISIHNIYADQNYLAIKMNPIGIMPVMFSTAFFALPQFLVVAVLYFFPNQVQFLWLQENLTLSHPLGIVTYLFILYFITIFFARIMLNPKEMTDNLLKNGDSLENLHPGEPTKRYLSHEITRLSFLGATVMGICIMVPIVLAYRGNLEKELMMLPSSLMMLTGMGVSLYQEIRAIRHMDSYRMFI